MNILSLIGPDWAAPPFALLAGAAPAGPVFLGGLALGFALARVGRGTAAGAAPAIALAEPVDRDPLTGLGDAASLRRALAARLAAEDAAPFALVCLELDQFGLARETLGPALADELLQETARRLQECVGSGDAVARLGADRFALLLHEGRTREAAADLTRRLLDRLHRPCESLGASLAVRLNAGIAMAPEHGAQAEPLLGSAIRAMQSAMAESRGDFRFFDPVLAAGAHRGERIESGLRQALAAGGFELRLNPRLDLHSRRVNGFEALAHWCHPELGDVPPHEWRPVARQAGLLPELGDWLLRAACRAAQDWPADARVDGPRAPGVAVHVEAAHLLWQQRRGGIDALLDELGFPARRLEVGVAAALLDGSEPAAVETLQAWQARGVRIALDRFGAGDASLVQLRRFRFDALSLDAEFVHAQLASAPGRNTLETILELAARLGIETVACGVQTARQAETLRRFGCAAVQGDIAGPALPQHAVTAFLGGRAGASEPR